MDALWTIASVLAALAAAVAAICIALKPRRFKPKGDTYWKAKARAMQKRYTGQVVAWEPALTKRQAKPKAPNNP